MSDHAKQESPASEGQEKPSGGGSIVPWIAVGVISAGLGSAMPFMLAGQSHAPADAEHAEEAAEAEHEEAVAAEPHGSGPATTTGQGITSKSKKVKAFTLPKDEETVFQPFGDPDKDQRIAVNLNEGRLTRFLSFSITLQIPKAVEVEFKKKVDAKKFVLRNWLLSKVSDLSIEDIRGAAGQNRLRREIRDHFNSVLCPDGYDQIYDVLFEEFNVQ